MLDTLDLPHGINIKRKIDFKHSKVLQIHVDVCVCVLVCPCVCVCVCG